MTRRDVLPDTLPADGCPVCQHVHGEFPDQLWDCPTHAHRLLEHGRNAEGHRVHKCPARGCGYHRLNLTPEPPLTTEPEPAAELAIPADSNGDATPTSGTLAIRAEQPWWNKRQLAALNQLGLQDASDEDLLVFMHYCQRTGLDPFAGQACMIKRAGRWTIQTQIDGFRLIASRAARRDGRIISYGPTYWYDHDGEEHNIWVRSEPPAAAVVKILVDGAAFTGYARYASFVALKDGKPMAQWASMPDHMIAKCAEAQALRKAFPNDLADHPVTASV